MARKRRTKRPYQVRKRCRCLDRNTCGHHWFLRVRANGERQSIDLTAMFPGDAVEVAAARAKDLARKGLIVNGRAVKPVTDARLTLGDIADRYGDARPRKDYYLDALRGSQVPTANGGTIALEAKPIDDVTTADIKHAVATWRTRKRTKAGAKGGAVAERHMLQTARHLFNWSIREGHSNHTPFRREGVSLITIRPSKGRTRRLEADEDRRLRLAACEFIADFYAAMIETACRPGELRTLQWSEVKDDHFVILAAKAKDRDERRIPILPTLAAIFERRRIGPDGQPLPEDAYVLGNETGDCMSRRRLCDLWLKTCQRAKVTDLHLHDLRGEAGSQLLEAGVPIHEVRDALGHSSTTMTSAYLRTRTDSLKSAYEQRAAHQARQALKVV